MVFEEKALAFFFFFFSKIKGGSQFCNNREELVTPIFYMLKIK
jgi:hypothetical protein